MLVLLLRAFVNFIAAVPAVANLPSEGIVPWARCGLFRKADDVAGVGGARNRRSESGDDESDDVELHLPIKNVI